MKSGQIELKTHLALNLGERDVNSNHITVGNGMTRLPVSVMAGKQSLCHYEIISLLLCLFVFLWLKIYVKIIIEKIYVTWHRTAVT